MEAEYTSKSGVVKLFNPISRVAKHAAFYKDRFDRHQIIEMWRRWYREEFEKFFIQICPKHICDKRQVVVFDKRGRRVFTGLIKDVAIFLCVTSRKISCYVSTGAVYQKKYRLKYLT